MEQQRRLRAFVSWSGGKDAALSYFRAREDFQITHLLNMVAEDGVVSRSHGLRTNVLRMQADAMNLTMIQPRSTWETYENEFKRAVTALGASQIEAGIFGDIDLEGHREWVERVCTDLGISVALPLWHAKREDIMREFIDAGFEAVVVATKKDVMGLEWLGRRIDDEFIRDMAHLEGVDLAGENGEYHTLVLSGPGFGRSIRIVNFEKIIVDQHCFLDITDCELVDAGA